MKIVIDGIEYKIMKHALVRMEERNISIDKVREVVSYGVKLINKYRRKDGTGRINNEQYRFMLDGIIVIVEYEPFPRIITVAN